MCVLFSTFFQTGTSNENKGNAFALQALFVDDTAKFISGVMIAISTMLQLEVPHINVLSKCDLVPREELAKRCAAAPAPTPQPQHPGCSPCNPCSPCT